ncbi:hypothetical protein EVAR_65295_1 [Eumeta japonica]|uniref:Uncharacterized protein n=1 Tax=Eumeta variegata TaxID=151549 RepID=A0A4C1ZPP5_EUMVA|nr:hypothetical protein EVAR_65295_1 [Eumeta japonica]
MSKLNGDLLAVMNVKNVSRHARVATPHGVLALRLVQLELSNSVVAGQMERANVRNVSGARAIDCSALACDSPENIFLEK